ncbi:penicillin-binding transpeptidase domain-containing protein [Sutcliffiella cohnii]|uniref:penicillin-binding transpeptidase domain-containing protein n=1 Tax=Sutcliffiella cohnii TaxID=33932 RepID=UPI002E243AE2|nr:penicillin-binding transpeptidase domain-containing protein [Sutcliffiella cohnii]MED4018664.1 penicillin-binding transpeptidase domain-containing protein [Sutcliffiella cohnii]
MKKNIIIALACLLFLIGCQKEEEANPYNKLNDYIQLWGNSDYTSMYENYLTTTSKERFTFEEFGERYEKLYADLQVDNLKITIQDENIVWEELEELSIPISIQFDTLAGNIDYSVDVPFKKEVVEDEQEDWFIEWDTHFILPQLSTGDRVRIGTFKGVRGEILDSEGNTLAANGEVFEIGIVPGNFSSESLSEVASLTSLSEEFIENEYSQSWVQPDHFVPIRKYSLSDEQIVRELETIPGVSVRMASSRIYPYGESLAHLIGYIRPITAEELEKYADKQYGASDWIGKRGLEQLLEDRLRPIDGKSIYYEKEDGSTVEIARTEARNGETVQITINGNLQQSLYETLREEKGTAVIVEPETGKVRSLISLPSFDPNEYVFNLSPGLDISLSNDEDLPLLNRFHASYSPGSTIKLLTSMIALNNDIIDPAEKVEITEKQWQKDDSWGNYKVTRVDSSIHSVDLKDAIVVSDNIYFAQLGLKIGTDVFVDGLRKAGFGEALPFKYYLTPPQISNSNSISSEIALADTAYGQGEILLPLLHLANIYGGIVNNGNMMKPLLFDEEASEIWTELTSEEHAKQLQQYLRQVVTEGTARKANLESKAIAGKTGTAEIKREQGTVGTENGIFVSYDQQQPNIVTAILIEGVEDKGGSGYVVEKANHFYRSLNND